MAYFKEQVTRCRIHPAVGEPVMCSFGDGADFWTLLSLEVLAESQGATLRPRFEDLIGHLAEEGEDTDEFMYAIQELRHMDDSRGEA